MGEIFEKLDFFLKLLNMRLRSTKIESKVIYNSIVQKSIGSCKEKNSMNLSFFLGSTIGCNQNLSRNN